MRNIYLLVVSVFCVSAAHGASVVFLTAGAGTENLPIGGTRVAGDDIAEVYSSAGFGDGPVYIYQIAFSSSAPAGGDATTLSGAANILLSTTALTPSSPGSTPGSNQGADVETVFSGAFSDPVLHNGTFDIVFNLAAPFYYDPSAGNLLLNFDWTSSAVTNGLLDVSGSYSTPLVGSSSGTTQYGTFSSADTGVATEFSVAPEPGTVLLMGLGLGCAMAGWRAVGRG